jgi:hypothetical protein
MIAVSCRRSFSIDTKRPFSATTTQSSTKGSTGFPILFRLGETSPEFELVDESIRSELPKGIDKKPIFL